MSSSFQKNNSDSKIHLEPIVLSASVRRLQKNANRYVLETPRVIYKRKIDTPLREDKDFSSVLDLTLETEHSIGSQQNLQYRSYTYLTPKTDRDKTNHEFSTPRMQEKQFSVAGGEQRTMEKTPSASSLNGKKKLFSRTSKFRKTPIKSSLSPVPFQSVLCMEELKVENAQLLLENVKLQEKVSNLKEENEFLIKQMEKLTLLVNGQKNYNQSLSLWNKQLTQKISQYEKNAQNFHENLKWKQSFVKKYEILEHVHWRTKSEYQTILKLNKTLESKNECLLTKINKLSKLLEEKNQPKLIMRKNDPICPKCKAKVSIEKSVQPNRTFKEKGNRKDENFFELSPQ